MAAAAAVSSGVSNVGSGGGSAVVSSFNSSYDVSSSSNSSYDVSSSSNSSSSTLHTTEPTGEITGIIISDE